MSPLRPAGYAGQALHPNASYTGRQVAELVFQKSHGWFLANRAALHQGGFPAPISPIGHARWSGAALLEWMQFGSSLARRSPQGEAGADYNNVLQLRTRQLRQVATPDEVAPRVGRSPKGEAP